MKKVVLLLAVVLLAGQSYAQLSTRENDATVEKIGARPVAGDMALTFGINLSSVFGDDSTIAVLNNENQLAPGNLLTFRYYKTNDVVYRAGIRLYKESVSIDGSADSSGVNPGWITDREFKDSHREYDLVPGIEKHFDAANIFDVYAGGDLYLGFKRSVLTDKTSFSDGSLDNTKSTTTTSVVGLGGVVGFNVFVAHLPIAVGLEYGWAAKWNLGGKTKVERETADAGGANSSSQTYYTTDVVLPGNDPVQFSSLKQKQFEMETNTNVRFVIHVYFSRHKG